jgi:TetR/AcrR family transcriptional regulator, transcriptional repressor for nem operon
VATEPKVAVITGASQGISGALSDVLEGAGPDRKKRAWSIIATMVGAVAIAQAMPDDEDADQVLKSALQTAVALIAPR